MTSLRKIFRRLRTLLWTALTLLTVIAAVIVGIGKLMMPYSDYYQPQLESWLSEAFNQPVKVESFEGEWKAFGPRIRLQGVTFMPQGMESAIAIKKAALDIKPLNILIPGRPLYSFRIIGADLALERTADGRYFLSGLGFSNSTPGKTSNPGLRDVALNGEIRLQDVSLSFDDPDREIHLVLTNINGRLKMDGRVMAAEIQARVTDRDRRRVVGDLEATVQLEFDAEQHLEQVRWHVKTGELLLAELVRQLPHHPLVPVSGRLNAEIWGQWQQDKPQEMQGVVDLRDAQLSSQAGPLLIDHLNSRINFTFVHPKQWRMDLSGLTIKNGDVSWKSEKFSVARNLAEDLGLWISADYLELNFPLKLTQRILANYKTTWPAAIPRSAQGNITGFDLLLDAKWGIRKVSGRLENGHFWGWEKGPEITGVNAQIDVESGAGTLSIYGQSVSLDWPRVFRRPVGLQLTDCMAEVQWANTGFWQFDLNSCHISNEDLSAFGRVRLASSESKPEIDINVFMERGDISRFGDYWPENIMSERTLRWLRTSLLSGSIEQGRFSMLGDLDDFPFSGKNGRMQAVVMVKDASVSFAEGWPRTQGVSGVALFDGPGMFVEAQIGNTGGVRVENVTARIANFKNPELELFYQSPVGMSKLIKYIRQTPLLDGLEVDPEQFVFDGPAVISGRVYTGLGVSTVPLQVQGNLLMQDVKFTELVSAVEIDAITGTLEYDREGLKATQLTAAYRGYPATLDIVSEWDADEVLRASLHGNFPVDIVIPDDLLRSESMFSHASGTSKWDISLSVASIEGWPERETWLEIFSTLEGTTIDLPAPLSKEADSVWPLMVRYPINTQHRTLTVTMPGRINVRMELSEDYSTPTSAAIQFGDGKGELPAAGTFVVNGSVPVFDLDGWTDVIINRLTEEEDVGGLALQSVDIDAEQLIIFNRLFDKVGLTMRYQDAVIFGEFDGKDFDGSVRYYRNEQGSHSMTGEFERLIMPDPISEGITMKSDPADMPEIHFYAKQFSYLGLELGETRIEGYPIKNGFHLDSIEAHSPSLIFSAHGDWLKDENGERSDFNIRMTSESLGALLEAMDLSSAMRGGQTVVNFDAWWEGPPAAFALERLNGEMDLNVVQGNILTVDPGAGRMLGLLSLTELPRRLSMDFRDVFGDGFNFDEAKGTMHFENGISYTDDLTLSSTAAEITIVGTTDLVAQTFDYEFAVRPGVSKALPVIGAIAGGPIGVAAGLALQALLRDSLGEAAEARYTIQGPWEDPLVEPVIKKRASEDADDGLEPAAQIDTELPEQEQSGQGNGTEDDND